MPSFTQPSRIIITCSKWLSPSLQKEVSALGYTIKEQFQTGVQINGTLNDCIRLNLNLRCASQILYSIKSFDCDSPQQLYDEIRQIQWESIFDKEGYFSISSRVDHPSINNSLFANVKVKDAIVDRFREKFDMRPNSGSELNDTVIHLFWRNETAEIFIDTSGETVAKHGYRKIPGHAPMLESLAAATLLSTVWDGESAFINPMCGSGTLAIEAAMIASNRRPGLFRDSYGFMHVSGYDHKVYEREKDILKTQVKDIQGIKIIATDISEDAINISKINAGAAGVGELIEFEVCDFRDTKIPEESGVVWGELRYYV